MVGTMIPRMPGCSASHSISATERSTPWVMGTSAMPPWRSGLRAAHLGQEPVVRPGAGEGELGVGDGAGREPGPEGRRGHAGDGVGVGEHDLGRDAVGIELLVALLDVPGAAQPLLVVRLPPHDVVVIHLELLVPVGVALGQVLVELPVVLRVEVGPVPLAVQPGVGVGRDDRVAARSSLRPEHREVVVALVDEGLEPGPWHRADDATDLGRGPLRPVEVHHAAHHEIGHRDRAGPP